MPELTAALAGVVIPIGIAMLAASSGASVKVAANEIGAKTVAARVTVGVLGLALIAWGGWSLRSKPFELREASGSRLDLLDPDRGGCPRAVEVAVLVRFENAPGNVRYEVRLGPNHPIKTFSQKFTHTGSGSDVLGPVRIRLRRPIPGRLRPTVVVVSPDLLTHVVRGIGPEILTGPARRCGLL